MERALRLARRVVAALADRVACSVLLWERPPGDRQLTFYPLALAAGSDARRVLRRVVDPVRGEPALTVRVTGGVAFPAWCDAAIERLGPIRDDGDEWRLAGEVLRRLDCAWLVAHGGPDRDATDRELRWLDGLIERAARGEEVRPADEPRILAVDWSGRAGGEGKTLWLAEAGSEGLLELRDGWTRESLCEHLVAERRLGQPMIVGLDFAFSFPRWFVARCGHRDAPALWAWMAEGGHGEAWLRACEPPFWGRPGRRRAVADGAPAYRRAELLLDARPKSVFQIGGAGAVGTGSLRGMPLLARLRGAGFAVWPFDDAGEHTVIEIYPRLFTGKVVKRDARRRAQALEAFPEIRGAWRQRAAGSEDGFDAAVSAVAMWRRRDELRALPPAADEVTRVEGAIWR